MKAKLNITKDKHGNVVSMAYAGLKREKSVSPIYKKSVEEANRRESSYSHVDESVMKLKFSI